MKMRNLLITLGLFLTAITVFGIGAVLAKPQAALVEQANSLHPGFALLDQNGENVLASGDPVSTIETCGKCHDVQFIQSHAFHSDLGLSDYAENGGYNSSPGTFGKWDPLTYRYLSQQGDERLDLSTAEWLKLNGGRVVGGGPATTSRDGQPLEALTASADRVETAILNENGEPEPWDWNASGIVEMNCFLCHLENPATESRAAFIQSGAFGDANTATLTELGIVSYDESTKAWSWNPDAFDENGELKSESIKIQDPANDNCAACHGEVHTGPQPLTLSAGDLDFPQTATTGQVIAAQKISKSGVNLSGKDDLNRSWDIHAERQLTCTSCHYAPNNPAHAGETQKTGPDHLQYDPRVLDIDEYLEKPDHNFARGQSAQYNAAPDLEGSMRRCESCHDAVQGHADWLPYIDRHMAAVACETCHIPQMYAPAIQSYDWTVLTQDGEPVKAYRGVEGDPEKITSLVRGYEPALLNRTNIDGEKLLAPYNLITSYYWVYDDANGNQRPVRLLDLESVYFSNGLYATDIVSAFDTNGDGSLTKDEMIIDSVAKEKVVQDKLASLGLTSPRIEGLTQPYSINHNVTRGENAVNDCRMCHSDASRVTQPIKLANYTPNGVLPVFDAANNVNASGEIAHGEDGAVYYTPIPTNDEIYIFGSSRVGWIDWLGALIFVGALVGVAGHGTARLIASRKNRKGAAQDESKGPVKTERIYMYESYRRFWHWLQTITIVLLLFTGLIIHRPDLFGIFSFRGVVTVHNVLAVILVINAALSLFYHITTDRVREFIPRPCGFFDDAIIQARYYINGIFRDEPHPFEKRPDARMNPIQKATYFAILNVLLPLQILTGALMWSVQAFPEVAMLFGGLLFLAPFHAFIAWTFAAFILVHVYMTTTGTTPLEATHAMITGYEEVEIHEQQKEEVKNETRPLSRAGDADEAPPDVSSLLGA